MGIFYVAGRLPVKIRVEAASAEAARAEAEGQVNPEVMRDGDVEIINPLTARTNREKAHRGTLLARLFGLKWDGTQRGYEAAGGYFSAIGVYNMAKKLIEEGDL